MCGRASYSWQQYEEGGVRWVPSEALFKTSAAHFWTSGLLFVANSPWLYSFLLDNKGTGDGEGRKGKRKEKSESSPWLHDESLGHTCLVVTHICEACLSVPQCKKGNLANAKVWSTSWLRTMGMHHSNAPSSDHAHIHQAVSKGWHTYYSTVTNVNW